MLKTVKANSLEDLIKQAIPENIRDPQALEDNIIGDPHSGACFPTEVQIRILEKQNV